MDLKIRVKAASGKDEGMVLKPRRTPAGQYVIGPRVLPKTGPKGEELMTIEEIVLAYLELTGRRMRMEGPDHPGSLHLRHEMYIDGQADSAG